MLNNFIYAQSKAMFEEWIAEVPNDAIVFIEDTKEIWTHGTYFDCSTLDPSIIPNLQMEIDELRMAFNNKADVDGNYPDMTVGFAEDLGGAEFTQESEFTIRATADGETVKDGAARIESIKGNSAVWNQKINNVLDTTGENGWWLRGSTQATIDGNKIIMATGASGMTQMSQKVGFIEGRKYLIAFDVNVVSDVENIVLVIFQSSNLYGDTQKKIGNITQKEAQFATIYTADASMPYFSIFHNVTLNDGDITTLNGFKAIDLTQMFGADNEPTTIAEFYQRIPMDVDLNAYNEGEVIHMDAQSIESQGVNAWDEQWEVGDINGTTGVDFSNTNTIRTGFIRVIPNLQYYISIQGKNRLFIRARLYDANKKFIGITSASGADIYTNEVFTIPSNAHYIRFAPQISVVAQSDLFCINLSDTSINGKYFPYIKRVEDLAVIRKYFPQGMKSAGSAHDEIRYNKQTNKWEKVVRIGEVDLGTLNWDYVGASDSTYSMISDSLKALVKPPQTNADKANVLCVKFVTDTADGVYSRKNKESIGLSYTGRITIYAEDYTSTSSPASFKAAMQGVILYYELAEPIITEIEDPGFSYQVWNGGTEQIVASNSAPFKADITYNFSANEWIKQNRFDIEKLNTSLNTHYGVCNTAVDTAAKTVTVGGNFSLVTGAQVVVKFTNGNTANPSTLNVNNTGAKNITTGYGKSFNINGESILTFEYDGTSWNVISSNQMITSGNTNNGYTLQTINSQTSGLAIANGFSVTDSVDGDLYIAHGGTNENAIYCTGGNIVTTDTVQGNIVTATGAVQGNIVHNTRTITATTTLDAKDNIVLCNNSSEIDINIKMNQVLPGQVFTVIKTTTTDVNVRTLSATNSSVPLLRVLDTSMTSVSVHDLSGIGVWNLYCIGNYIYLYKL